MGLTMTNQTRLPEERVNPTDGSLLLLLPEGMFLAGDKRKFRVELPPYYLPAYSRYERGDLAAPVRDASANRVLRGGPHDLASPQYFRCAYRYSFEPPDVRVDWIGFRVAWSPTL
jgi:hypothetical protein